MTNQHRQTTMQWNSRVLGSFWNFQANDTELQRSFHTSTVDQSVMYILGGLTKDTQQQTSLTNSFIKYHLESGEYKSMNIILEGPKTEIDPKQLWISMPSKPFSKLPPLAHHTTTAANKRLYVFGGMTQIFPCICSNLLYQFDCQTSQWFEMKFKGQAPKPRYGHTTLYHNKRLYVFGGTDGDNYFADLHIFDLPSQTWIPAKTHGKQPGPRSGHSACLYGDNIFVFAGGNDKKLFNDVMALDTNTLTWRPIKIKSNFQPAQRMNHTASIIANTMIVVGGNGRVNRNEILKLDMETLEWCEVKPSQVQHSPPILSGHTASIVDTQLWILGGSQSSESLMYTLETGIKGVKPLKLPPSMISADLETLVNDKTLSDIIFEFPSGEHYYGHLAIFRVRCPVLHRICIKHDILRTEELFSYLLEKSKWQPKFEFDPTSSVTMEIFDMLMSYIYMDELPDFLDLQNSQNGVYCLMTMAKLIKMDRLYYFCMSQMTTNGVGAIPAPSLSHHMHQLYKVAMAHHKALQNKEKQLLEPEEPEALLSDEEDDYDKKDESPLFDDTSNQMSCSTEEYEDSQQEYSSAGDAMSVSTDFSALTSLNRINPAQYNHCDVMVHVGETQIPAHRCILIARSDYFRRILITDNPNEPFRKDITVDGVSESALLKVLEFIYCDSLTVHFDFALELLLISEAMELDRLSALCQQVIERKIRTYNVVEFLNIANKWDLSHLRESCMYFMVHHLGQIKKTASYRFHLDHETRFEIKQLRKKMKGQGLYDYNHHDMAKQRKRSVISAKKKKRSNKYQQSKKPKTKKQRQAKKRMKKEKLLLSHKQLSQQSLDSPQSSSTPTSTTSSWASSGWEM